MQKVINVTTYLIIILYFISCKKDKLYKISDSRFIQMALENDFPDPKKVSIYHIDGTIISVDSLAKLELTQVYFEDFYANSDGEIAKVQVRIKTKVDDDLIAKINRELNKTPEIKIIDINCENYRNLLDSVFISDQSTRLNGNINREIDLRNLQIVISVLETCSNFTFEVLTKKQKSGLWLTLQHADEPYQSKYIPVLEKAAEAGHLKWSVIALMTDRALMLAGKPQIYGSQINNDTLYQLAEPKYVDKKREEMGLGPLSYYLERFNIDFTVPQKLE